MHSRSNGGAALYHDIGVDDGIRTDPHVAFIDPCARMNPRRTGDLGRERSCVEPGSFHQEFLYVEKADARVDRKSTRLNSSHLVISYAVFCLKKKTLTIEKAKRFNACMV